MQKVENVEKRLDSRMDSQDVRMDTFATQIQELQVSGAASSGAAQGAIAPVGNRFVPSFVDIKNFCKYSERKSKGISRDQAEELVKKLSLRLPESMKSKIGELELFGSKVHKFRVHVKPPGAVEVALNFKETLTEDKELHFNDMIQYTVAERPEESEKRYQAAGKTLAYVETKVIARDNVTTVCKCSWNPAWNLTVASSTPEGAYLSEVVVGSVREDASIEWSTEGLHTALAMNEATARSELAAFRQA